MRAPRRRTLEGTVGVTMPDLLSGTHASCSRSASTPAAPSPTSSSSTHAASARTRCSRRPRRPNAPSSRASPNSASTRTAPERARIVHGSTVATNAALEGKGARTAYVADRGLGDVPSLGRQDRPELYDLTPPPLPEPVPEALRVEVDARLDARGAVVRPLSADGIAAVVAQAARLAPEAVAINLLFSWRDDAHERRLETALARPTAGRLRDPLEFRASRVPRVRTRHRDLAERQPRPPGAGLSRAPRVARSRPRPSRSCSPPAAPWRRAVASRPRREPAALRPRGRRRGGRPRIASGGGHRLVS
jgi:hypothetical protein